MINVQLFILGAVKLAVIQQQFLMKECGSKHTLTPPTYFLGVRTPNPPPRIRPLKTSPPLECGARVGGTMRIDDSCSIIVYWPDAMLPASTLSLAAASMCRATSDLTSQPIDLLFNFISSSAVTIDQYYLEFQPTIHFAVQQRQPTQSS